MQRHKDVRLAGVDHLDIRTVGFHLTPEGQRHVQVDGFLLGQLAQCTGIIAAMSGINDQNEFLIGSNSRHCQNKCHPD